MDNKLSILRTFGKFRLDTEKRVLWYQGEPVNMALKEIELLCALTEKSGEVITKAELLDKVWRDSFVEESNLSRHIYILRKTFEEYGEKDLIQTVPRRGYRFTGEVREIGSGEFAGGQNGLTQPSIKTEEGGKEEKKERRESASPVFFLSARFLFASFVALLVLLVGGFAFWYSKNSQSGMPLAEIKSIAVLPFKTIDSNGENEHQGLGLTDVLITRLSNIRELNVRPTSAVLGFGNQDSISFGRKLNVDAVLEGTIYRTGDKVRVTARFLKVSDQTPIWAGQFEKTLQDELKLQDEIALQVVDALALDLSSGEKNALTKRFTESADAHQLYIKGRFEWNKRNHGGMSKAHQLFQQAIEKDPNFALAYVGLADSSLMSGDSHQAWLVLSKALELDPNLADAYASKGFAEMFYYWDWDAAEMYLKKSIELNPNCVNGHHWYAELLAIRGRNEEAQAEMRKALEINPLSYNFLADLGQIYYFNREYDTAKEYCEKALEIYPDFHFAHLYLQYIYLKTGEYDKAVEEYLIVTKAREALAVETIESKNVRETEINRVRQIYLDGGIEKWLKDHYITGGLEEPMTHSDFYGSALGYALLDDKENAIDNLEKAFSVRATHHFTMPFVKAEPIFDNLRDEPRYQEVLRKMKLND
jgi:DNA-binding winged helix-turn-helix (wHTH) protein/TolB-like protein